MTTLLMNIPNTITCDSDGYESDSAALQVMTTDIEPCDTQDIDSYMEGTQYFKLMKGKNGTTSFLPKKKKGWKSAIQ